MADLLTDRPLAPVPPRRLDAQDQAVVDEAFLRGASMDDAMDVLYVRAMLSSGHPLPPEYSLMAGARNPGRRERAGLSARPRFTLEDVHALDRPGPTDLQQRRLDSVANLRSLVAARFDAYVALTRKEFQELSPFVRASFAPIASGRYADPHATAEEKYRSLRGAYYRAGWTAIKRDVLDHIVVTTFFGVPIVGGTHRELNSVLAAVEADIVRTHPHLSAQVGAAGFVVGGFVPRFQGESTQLSNHAFGLAVDIDAPWNPQIKTATAIAAFKQATGEQLDQLLVQQSTISRIQQTHDRIAAASRRLKAWLNEWLPKYTQLQQDRAKLATTKGSKGNVTAIDNEMKSNPNLKALATLIREYTLPTVQAWQAYGIVTIPAEIIISFLRVGKPNNPRWGGEYDHSKDGMHLELLQLAAPTSLARSGGAGRRRPIDGLDDLVRLTGNPNGR